MWREPCLDVGTRGLPYSVEPCVCGGRGLRCGPCSRSGDGAGVAASAVRRFEGYGYFLEVFFNFFFSRSFSKKSNLKCLGVARQKGEEILTARYMFYSEKFTKIYSIIIIFTSFQYLQIALNSPLVKCQLARFFSYDRFAGSFRTER